jgi:FAD-dependent urate hydroxylase
MAFRTLPPELQSLPEPLALHSARIADVSSYANRDVCIIGAGQSALETAALLHEAGARVRLIVRRAQVGWNPEAKLRPLTQQALAPDAGVGCGWSSVAISELPRFYRWYFPAPKRHRFLVGSYGPSGSWWLRDRVRGKVEILLSTRLLGAAPENSGVRLNLDGPQGPFAVHADHVIAGTGYRVDIQKMEYLDPSLRDAMALEAPGIPALDSHFESSVPGLFVVGLASAPVFGPIMRFMYGAKHPAAVVTRRLS